MGGIVFYAYILYVDDLISIGNILAYLNYMIMLMMNFGSIVGVLGQMGFMTGAADKLMQIILHVPLINFEGGDKMDESKCSKGVLEFRDVHFTYPSRDDVEVLKGISFTVDAEKKRVIALCGTSGCGKSTTIAMCERFYDPQSGQVLYNGRDIRELDLRWYHS